MDFFDNILKCNSSSNYLKKDTQFTVLVNNETKLIELLLPKTLSNSDEISFERREITLGDIKPGDTITAIAGENIKGKTEFLAKQIEKHKVK